MKRLILCIAAVCMCAGLTAENLKIGTIRGTAMFAPPVLKVFGESGLPATLVPFNEQGDLIQALAKGEIDGAFFLAQPIIAQIPGAIMIAARLHQTDFYAISTDPSIKINNPGDLRKYSVGIVKDNMAHIAITRGVKTTECATDPEEFAKLKAGAFQVGITVDKLAPIMAKAVGLQSYYLSERPLLRTPTFLALSGSQAANKAKLEAAFREWQTSGKWEAEMSKVEGSAHP